MAALQRIEADHATAVSGVTPMAAPEARTLGVVAALLGMGIGAWLTLHLHVTAYDAVSRVEHAFDVLFSGDPHLAAIGFVWTPLSSLMEMPLVLFYKWWPALVTLGFAGVFVSAFFAGIGAAALTRILARLGLPPAWRWIVALGYILNPMVLLYSANGMTDGVLMACTLACYERILEYLDIKSVRALAGAAFWLVVALGDRYEAVPLGLFLAAGLVVSMPGLKKKWSEAAGAATILLAPLAYGGALWIFLNWLIMKNPLYFWNSNYSNLAETTYGNEASVIGKVLKGHAPAIAIHMAQFTIMFPPFDLGLLAALIFILPRYFDRRALVILFGTVGLLALDFAMAYKGTLPPWDRYFLAYVPSGVVLIALATSNLLKAVAHRPWLARTALAASAIVLLAGNIGTYAALKTPPFNNPDGSVLATFVSERPLPLFTPAQAALIRFINDHPHLTVLTDEYDSGVPIDIWIKNQRQLITTPDQDFMSVLQNPRGRVDAFLVPQPTLGAVLDAVNRQWPGLYYGRYPWARLYRQFLGVGSFGANYRLFLIEPNAP